MSERVNVDGGDPSAERIHAPPCRPETVTSQDAALTFVGVNEVQNVCAAAEAAFETYRAIARDQSAAFLERIGTEILAVGDDLIVIAMRESRLPLVRLEGERGRTVGQLRLFAEVVRQGAYLGLRVDPALANGGPTGVEVAHAIVHGGPYPAKWDTRTTSVGSLATDRFLRPVCYQHFASGLLPAELRDEAIDKAPRLVDGKPG